MAAQTLLRRETKYGVWTESKPLRPSRFYFGTEDKPFHYFRKSWWLEAKERSEREPVKLHEYNGRTWWRFRGEVFTEASKLSVEDVQALASQLQREKDKTLKRAHAQMKGEAESGTSRERIPQSVRNEVWQRDKGACVDCGSRERLEYDHIIPISEGGANTARNIELRCEVCNRSKGSKT
jgi:5-methylcytosine-specific restriction endonuclease McrA